MDLPRTIEDRIMYGIACLLLTFLFTPFLALVYYWAPDDIPAQVVKFLVEEVLFLFFSGFVLAFIWCLCTPKWVETLLAKRTAKFAVISAVLFVGLLVALFTSAIMHNPTQPIP